MKRILVLLSLLVLTPITIANAVDSIYVESKTVAPGGSVAIGVFVSNNVSLEAIYVPLEVRAVTPGAFIANTAAMTIQGRVAAAYTLEGTVSDSAKSGGCFPSPADGVNYVSPDMFHYSAGSGTLTAGSDGATPSFVLTVGVSCEDGTFEVDTACYANQRVAFDPVGGGPNYYKPGFGKGTITISADAQTCTCNDNPADVNCDGIINVVDYTIVYNVAFRGDPEPVGCCQGSAGTASIPPPFRGSDDK